jgi:hypothetical protein
MGGMPRATARILTEITDLRSELHDFRAEARSDSRHLGERIDGVNTRLDTVIDAVAQLRTDFANHTHD